jgi:hypothetical protein
MCATVSWGAHESFMHPIFVLKNGCDSSRLDYAFYRAILHGSVKFCAHHWLTIEGLEKAAGATETEIMSHLSYRLRLLDLLTRSLLYVPQ